MAKYEGLKRMQGLLSEETLSMDTISTLIRPMENLSIDEREAYSLKVLKITDQYNTDQEVLKIAREQKLIP